MKEATELKLANFLRDFAKEESISYREAVQQCINNLKKARQIVDEQNTKKIYVVQA